MVEFIADHFKKPSAVHAHEIAQDVHFQYPGILGIIAGAAANERLHPANPVVCPLAFPATIAVFDKAGRYDGIKVTKDQVMYDAVAEVCREDFPLYRFVVDETNASADLVAAIANLISEPKQVFFVLQLELQCIRCFSLVLPGIIVGLEKVKQQFFVRIWLGCHTEKFRGSLY